MRIMHLNTVVVRQEKKVKSLKLKVKSKNTKEKAKNQEHKCISHKCTRHEPIVYLALPFMAGFSVKNKDRTQHKICKTKPILKISKLA